MADAQQLPAERVSGGGRAGFNIDELVIDGVVAVFSIIALFLLIPEGRTIREAVTPALLAVMLFVIDFFVAFHVGRIFRRFSKKSRGERFLGKIAAASGALTLFFLFIAVPVSMSQIVPEWGSVFLNGVFMVAGFWLMFCGAMFGLASGADSTPAEIGGLLLVLPTLVGIVPWVMWGNGAVEKLYKSSTRGYRAARFAIGKIITPFLVAVSLVFTQQLYIEAQLAWLGRQHGRPDLFYLVFVLAFFGIIPLRLASAIAPPVRLKNILIGLVSFGLYVWQLVLFLGKVAR